MALADVLKEAGLSSDWSSVEFKPVRPGSTGAPPSPTAMAPYFQGSLAQNLQHDASFVGVKYGSPSIPQFPLIPVAPSGTASIQSAIQSGSSVQIINSVSAVAAGANGQVQFNKGGALGASSAFSWDNINDVLSIIGAINAVTGYQFNGIATTGHVLRGNGTYFVDAQLTFADLGGSIWNTVTKTTNYNAVAGDVVGVDTTGGPVTITFPSAAANTNKSIRVKKISNDNNLLSVTAADLLDGLSTQSWINQWVELEAISTGTTWWIV